MGNVDAWCIPSLADPVGRTHHRCFVGERVLVQAVVAVTAGTAKLMAG